MRIVAGRHRGRAIAAPEGLAVRPTADRAREALFNLLAHGRFLLAHGRFGSRPIYEDAHVLDAFAGTGALGLEALSRGARFATFFETDPTARRTLAANVATLGESRRAAILAADAVKPPRAAEPATLVFLDPPYGEGLAAPALQALDRAGWLTAGALVAVEVSAREAFDPPPGFALRFERRYGAARLVFLGRADV